MTTRGIRLTVIVFLMALCVGGRIEYGRAADVAFRWAILADTGDGMKPLDFSKMPVIHSGTPMQFYLEHLQNCYIYLYLLDAGGQLAALFPMTSGYYSYGFPRGQKYFPPGDRHFTFVPPGGTETFIMVALSERPMQLEKLTNELLENPQSLQQQQLLLSVIDSMIKDREERSRKDEDTVVVERRTTTVSGIVTTTFQAAEVDSGSVYGRRLLIDHR